MNKLKREMNIPFPEDVNIIKEKLIEFSIQPDLIKLNNILKFIFPTLQFNIEDLFKEFKLKEITFKKPKVYQLDNVVNIMLSGFYDRENELVYFEYKNEWFKYQKHEL